MFHSSKSDLSNFSQPDVVLIQCAGWGCATPPLSLASLASFGRACGFKVLPIDLNIEHYLNRPEKYKHVWDIDRSQSFWNIASFVKQYGLDNKKLIQKHVDAIIATGTKLVAFSVYASCLELSFIYARLIKENKPSIKVVFGGPHVSMNMAGQYALNQDCVDAIAQGEGELIFLEMISRVKHSDSLKDIKGIIAKIDGKIVDYGKMESIRDVSSLPFADFSDYNFSNYKDPSTLPLMSSRGCPNQCIYCSEVVFWDTYRGYSAERVVDEIEHHLQTYPQLNRVEFQDSLVNGHIGRLEQFADEVIERGLKFRWVGQAVIRKEMNWPLFKKLKRSGCACLAYGLETSSVNLMIGIGKLLAKGSDIDRLVVEAHAAGISCAYNFMFGMPGETEEDARKSLEFLRKHKKHVGTVNPSAAFCGFTPGTPGFDTPETFDIVPSPVQGQYWKTVDGTNDLLVRLRRFEDFCSLAQELGVPSTYPHSKLQDRDKLIGSYHYYFKNYPEALVYLERWLESNPNDEEIIWFVKNIKKETPQWANQPQ